MIKNFKWLLLVSLTFVACNSDDEVKEAQELPITAGSADFSRYVALGNSLTSGFSDNALFIASQENAYPKLMADQFALAGGGEFKTPFMNDNVGGMLLGGNMIAFPSHSLTKLEIFLFCESLHEVNVNNNNRK